MICGTGIDIIEIDRIKRAVERHPNFLNKHFTEVENLYFMSKKNSPQSISGYFAAKEAVSKALGTGFRSFRFIDIEIEKDSLNKPFVNLYGNAKKIAQEKHIGNIHLSISHSREYAVAHAIATIERLGLNENLIDY